MRTTMFEELRKDISHYKKLLEMELRKPPLLRSNDRIRSYRESIRSMEYALAEVAGMHWVNNLETWNMVVSNVDGY
jgi:hypothetical protein